MRHLYRRFDINNGTSLRNEFPPRSSGNAKKTIQSYWISNLSLYVFPYWFDGSRPNHMIDVITERQDGIKNNLQVPDHVTTLNSSSILKLK